MTQLENYLSDLRPNDREKASKALYKCERSISPLGQEIERFVNDGANILWSSEYVKGKPKLTSILVGKDSFGDKKIIRLTNKYLLDFAKFCGAEVVGEVTARIQNAMSKIRDIYQGIENLDLDKEIAYYKSEINKGNYICRGYVNPDENAMVNFSTSLRLGYLRDYKQYKKRLEELNGNKAV